MKIHHVINSLSRGGAERFVLDCLNHNFGHDLIVLKNVVDYNASSKKIYNLNLPHYKSIIFLLRKLSFVKSDVFIFHLYISMAVGALFRIFSNKNSNFFFFHHHSPFNSDLGSLTKLSLYFLRFYSRFFPLNAFFLSRSSYLLHRNFGLKFNRFMLVRLGVDNTIFKEQDLVSFTPSNFSSSSIKIGYFSRFTNIKGHSFLFNVCALLPFSDFHLYLAGKGISSTNSALVDLINSFGLNDKITLLGDLDHPEHYYPFLDIHFLASKSESFGLVSAESILCGTLAISTDVGHQCDIIGNPFLVFDYGDIPSAIDSIMYVRSLNHYEYRLHVLYSQNIVNTKYTLSSNITFMSDFICNTYV